MSKFTTWKTQPIFISSTFTDMMAERDALRDFVFPELEAKLLERKTRLEAIDLRWGVETSDEKEQEEKELLVLKVCLDEIDRSLPFFIGIIGDRYGWVPPKERLETVEGEKGFKSEIKDKSVTALEIEYGVLANKEQLERSFFFFREPLSYNKIPEDSKVKYADIHIEGIDKDFARKRVDDFKKLIESKVGKDKVFTYSTEWDTKNNKVTGLEDFKQKVFEQLWKELDEQTKNEEDTRPKTWQDEERIYLDEFVEGRTISFSGRENIIARLKTFANAESGFDNWGLCLSGESGGGKSALFAKVYKELKNENDVFVLGHAAGISLRSNSLSNMLNLWIEELAKELQIDISEQLKETSEFEDLRKQFSDLLSQVAVNKRVVVLVDALNQFENTDQAKHVNWLPELIPANAKIIFTAITGEETKNLSKRKGINVEKLEPINKTDAEEIISIICSKYHKELNQKVINKLLDKKKEDGTPAYSNALWLTMAIDEFLLLDEDDFNRMKGLEGNAEQKLLQLLLNTADELPADIPGMYNFVFERAGIFGKEFVNSILSYIGISRNGLRESDLEKLINNYTNSKWEPLNFAAFRRYLRSHLVRKGEIGLWDFRHMQVRESLKNSLLSYEKEVKKLHSNLAEQLIELYEDDLLKKASSRLNSIILAEQPEKLPKDDPLYLSEVLWHLFKCDNKIEAAEIYGKSSDDDETDIFSSTIKDILLENEDNTEWIASLVSLPKITDDIKRGIINNILFNLDDHIKDYIRTKPRLNILKKVNKAAKQLSDQNPKSTEDSYHLSTAYNKVGDIYKDRGKNNNALESYKNALKIREGLREQYPESDQYGDNSSVSYDRIGDIYFSLKEIENARENYESSFKIRKELIKTNSESIHYERGLSISYSRIGDCDMALDNTESARDNYENYLKITKKLYEQGNDSAFYAKDLSLAHNKIGDIYVADKKIKKAFDNYKSSLKIRIELHNRYPNSAEYARDLLVSYGRIGDAYNKHGDTKNTLTNYKEALKINKELSERFPGSASHKRDLFSSYIRIGDLYDKLKDSQNALNSFSNSLKTSKELHKLAPESTDFKKCLALSYYKIGDINETLGDSSTSIINYNGALDIRKKLKEEYPDSNLDTLLLLETYSRIGYIYNTQKDIEKALVNYNYALKIREELCERNPESIEYSQGLLVYYNQIGNVYKADGDTKNAIANYENSLKIQEELRNRNLTSEDELQNLFLSFQNIGKIYESIKDNSNALSSFEKALNVAKSLLDTDSKSDKYTNNLLLSLNNIASIHKANGNTQSAIVAYESALQILEGMVERNPQNLELHSNLAKSYSMIGNMKNNVEHKDGACELFEKATNKFQELHKNNPTNEEIIDKLTISYSTLASAFKDLEKFDQALKYYMLKNKLAEKMYIDNPESKKCSYDFANSHLLVGNVYTKIGQTKDAIDSFDKAIDLFQKLHKSNPEIEDIITRLTYLYSATIEIYQKTGQTAQALLYINMDFELSQELFVSNPKDTKYAYRLAISFYNLGKAYFELNQIDNSKKHYLQALKFFERLYEITGDEDHKKNYFGVNQILKKLNEQYPEK